MARRSLGPSCLAALSRAIRASVEAAWAHPDDPLPFMKAHAQDMRPAIMRAHVDLYVNEFTRSLGAEGREAILALAGRAASRGLASAGAALALARDLASG